MYTREILPPLASPVEDGVPVIGTWNRAFEKVDLLEIRRPYRYPFPRWARNYLIKEWQLFNAQNKQYFFEAVFFSMKLYTLVMITLYNKESGEKYFFRSKNGGSKWHIPNSLSNSSVDSHVSNFYFRIHSWLDAGTVRLDININETRRRPPLTIHLAYNANSRDVTPLAVSLQITEQRNMYAYKTLAQVHGDIALDGKHINLKQDTCSGFFCDYKGYYPYPLQTAICSSADFIAGNRSFGFHIAENQTRGTNRNNENALWVDGKLTPLPPVRITMPNGPDDIWVIQDVEGMVDLTFTPKEQNGSKLKGEFNAPMGYYNGMMVNREEEQFPIKNLFGNAEKINLRV